MSYYVFKQIDTRFIDKNISTLYSGPFTNYSDAEQSYLEKNLTNSELDMFIIHNLEPRQFSKIGDKEIYVARNKSSNKKSLIVNCCDPLEINFVINGISQKCNIETVKNDYVLVSYKSDVTGYRQEKLYLTELRKNPIVRELDINKLSCLVEFHTNYNNQKHWVDIIPLQS